MKAGATSSSRTLLDFGAGFLFGLSITVALFAAMEEDVGPVAHNMLLTALVLVGLAIAAKLAARSGPRRRRSAAPARRARNGGARHGGWTVGGVTRAAAAEARGAVSSSNDHKASHDARTSAALPELKATHRDAQTTAEGDSRRL